MQESMLQDLGISIKEESKIPEPKLLKARKGFSKYDPLIESCLRMPEKKTISVDCSRTKGNSLYSSLSDIVKRRNLKNLRIVQRNVRGKQRVFIQKLY